MLEKMLITPLGEKIYDALNDDRIKIILLPGGTRSSKTFSIMQCLHILMSSNNNLRVIACRAKQTWIRLSILNDWSRELLSKHDLSKFYTSTKVPIEYTLKATNSTLEMIGLDDPQKAHGVAGDIVWLNEAMEIEQNSFKQLMQRLKGKIILDYNPSEEEHYVYELANRSDCISIHSTYKDNPFNPDTVVREIEAYEDTPYNRQQGTVSEYHWMVYGLGLPAKKEGLIFPNWEIIDEYPVEARDLAFGLDFGFYPDPVAFGRVGMLNGRLVLDEMIYETELNNIIIKGKEHIPSIQGRFQELGISRRDLIVADSQAKTSISELKNVGYNISPVQKYPGSVNDGLFLMQKYMPFYVTSRSINTIKELKNYTWKKNPSTGLYTKDPIDKFNHLIDLYRYVVQTKIAVRVSGRPKVTLTRSR